MYIAYESDIMHSSTYLLLIKMWNFLIYFLFNIILMYWDYFLRFSIIYWIFDLLYSNLQLIFNQFKTFNYRKVALFI